MVTHPSMKLTLSTKQPNTYNNERTLVESRVPFLHDNKNRPIQSLNRGFTRIENQLSAYPFECATNPPPSTTVAPPLRQSMQPASSSDSGVTRGQQRQRSLHKVHIVSVAPNHKTLGPPLTHITDNGVRNGSEDKSLCLQWISQV